ncbi:MAG: acyl-CoA dehydratase activase-related protein [Desulfitobacteriaceae bacterium]
MKIGFPRAVHYYDYFPFWAGFFHSLDQELVTSPLTNRRILEMGLKKANDETCLPIKLLAGHLQALSDVDAIFLPRMVSMEERTYFCPKILGLPESIMGAVPRGVPVLTVNVNWREGKRKVLVALEKFGGSLGKGYAEVRQAFMVAQKWQERYEISRRKGLSFRESMAVFDRRLLSSLGNPRNGKEEGGLSLGKPLTIALVGHSYLTQESYANLDLLGKLEETAQLRLIEEVSPVRIEEELKGLRKKMFWGHAKKIMGAGTSFAQDGEVDGLIYLSCFGCGIDSMTQDMVARVARNNHKPYMMLTLDEHSGEAGLVTRLEAFLDMTERRVQRESDLSAHGKRLDRATNAL